MKSPQTLRQETYKKALTTLVKENPEARKTEKRYKVMRFILSKEWAGTLSMFDDEKLERIMKDICFIDRKIRLVTAPYNKEEKKILSQKYQIEELGMESTAMVDSFTQALETNI